MWLEKLFQSSGKHDDSWMSMGLPDLKITEIQPLPKVEQKYRDERLAVIT